MPGKMNIVMLTNTYTPHVGGVARSVAAFAGAYRKHGHRVLVVAPEFSGMPAAELDVVRIPAIQNFNGSDFSAVLPVSGLLSDALDSFSPDIVHSHHPYLLGMTAVRIARYRQVPLVFTHHTLYEQYTHYVPGDSPLLQRFVAELATHYANLCDQVFAPSESIAQLLQDRGVSAPVAVVPTGVNIARFAAGDGQRFRRAAGIPDEAFVIGHLGRLAPEKNLEFLAHAVGSALRLIPQACFLLVGSGPSEEAVRSAFERDQLSNRIHVAGILDPPALADAYHAMDVFAFASKSETQGMVLTEAMAAGVPVVGLDAPGVREVVKDGVNGRLLTEETPGAFAQALRWAANRNAAQLRALKDGALATANSFSMEHSADRAMACYATLLKRSTTSKQEHFTQWERVRDLIAAEWEILKGVTEAAGAALTGAKP
ncbi:MAG: glycosyltransferase [Burkholderiales bacterium]